MAALQLSARLEAAEKTLGQMLSLLTTIAGGTPGIDAATTEVNQLQHKIIYIILYANS